jgi:hypothetical protein
MTSYHDSREVERIGREMLRPFLQEVSGGRYVRADHGPLADYLQQLGDTFLQMSDMLLVSVEEKAERRHTGNLFVETWSNQTDDLDAYVKHGDKPGWFLTTRAMLLTYIFIDTGLLCVAPLRPMKSFLLRPRYDDRGRQHPPRIWDFPLREQRECDQLNHTLGHLVPISYLVRHCRCQCFQIGEDDLLPRSLEAQRVAAKGP